MTISSAILICDREHFFREALLNFLLAAGYSKVEVVASAREAAAKFRHQRYGCVLIGLEQFFSPQQRLATIAQRRQPEAKILMLVRAEDQPFIKDARFNYVIKEQVFSNLGEWLED